MGTEYFRLHPVLGILSNAPVLAGAIALLFPAHPRLARLIERHPAVWIGSLYFVTRVLFILFVVVQLRHVSLDLGTYFETQGWSVLQGRLPYRDFASSYAPLFPYLMALPALFRGPLPFFVFFAACDLLALVLVMRAVSLSHDQDAAAAGRTAARAGWIYAAAPVTWYFLVRYGQDEALAAAFLAAAACLLKMRRDLLSAAVLGLGFAATKFTFGIFIPPFAIASRGPARFLATFGIIAAAAYLPFAAAGLPVWRPLFAESAGLGFGPSVWRLPIVFTPFSAGWPVTLALAAGLLAVWFAPSLMGARLGLERHVLLTGCVFLVLSPKVMPMYATPFWPFAAIWLARHGGTRELIAAALLNVLLGVWWYFDAGGIHGMFGAVIQALSALVTAAVPVTLIAVAWHLWRAKSGRNGEVHAGS